MNSDLVDITIIMDRSGSMISCAQEAENGLNRLIEEQKAQPGDCNFTFIQFDDQYEVVCDGIPIKDAPKIELMPRGMTALNDAVGKTINTIGARLSAMPEDERPGLVMVVIVTDGHENASHEFNTAAVKALITQQQDKYNWQFTFLGANQDAFDTAANYNISVQSSANYSTDKAANVMGLLSNKMSMSRSAVACGQSMNFEYTDDERKEME